MRLTALSCLLLGLSACFMDHVPDLDATTTSTPSTSDTSSSSQPTSGDFTTTTSTTSTTSTTTTASSASAASSSASASSSSSAGSTGTIDPPACPNPIYVTTFDEPPAFTPLQGEWLTSQGIYSTLATRSTNISVLPNFDGDQFTVSTLLRFKNPASVTGISVYTSDNLSGAFVMLSPNNPKAALAGVINNVPKIYSELPIDPLPLNQWIKLSLSASMGEVAFAINDVPIGAAKTDFTQGSVGLFAQAGTLEFDEFTLCGH